MNEATAVSSLHREPLGFVDRIVTLLSWGVGGAVFLTIGWHAMAPSDPLAPVSVMSRANGPAMVLQAAGLAAVCAALATILAGRKLIDVGTFAVALGLSMVSLRGGTASAMLQQHAAADRAFEHALAWKFVVETVGWSVVMVVALLASAAIMSWVFTKPEMAEKHAKQASMPGFEPDAPGGLDLPWLSTMVFGDAARDRTSPVEGVKHAILCAGAGLVALSALSASLTSRSIEHGQVCFVIAASVFIASSVAHRVVPVRSVCWSILGVVLMAVLAYLWAAVRPLQTSLPPYVPSSHFLRILPLQFVAVGVAAAIAAAWYSVAPEHEA